MSQEANSTGERKEYLEAELHYDRTFGNHMVGAVMKYTQDKTINASVKKEDDIMQGIDRRHQGLSGRFTYGWKYRYFVDLTLVTMDPRTLQQVISSVSSPLTL